MKPRRCKLCGRPVTQPHHHACPHASKKVNARNFGAAMPRGRKAKWGRR